MQAFIVVLAVSCVLLAGTYAYAAARVRSADCAYEALRSAVRADEDLRSNPFYPALRESLRSSFSVALSDDTVEPPVDPTIVDKNLQDVEFRLFAERYDRESNLWSDREYKNSQMYQALREEQSSVVDKAMAVEKCLGVYLHHVGRENRTEATAPLATRDARRKAEWARADEAEQRDTEFRERAREREAHEIAERKIELG